MSEKNGVATIDFIQPKPDIDIYINGKLVEGLRELERPKEPINITKFENLSTDEELHYRVTLPSDAYEISDGAIIFKRKMGKEDSKQNVRTNISYG